MQLKELIFNVRYICKTNLIHRHKYLKQDREALCLKTNL